MNTINIPLPTIPQIAEMLAEHIRRDNDAPRLVVEHVLPTIGMEFNSVSDALSVPSFLVEVEEDFTAIGTLVGSARRRVNALSEVIFAADGRVTLSQLDAAHRQWGALLDGISLDLTKVLNTTDGRDS